MTIVLGIAAGLVVTVGLVALNWRGKPPELVDGAVMTLTGKAAATEPLRVAPLSGRNCMYWCTLIRLPAERDAGTIPVRALRAAPVDFAGAGLIAVIGARKGPTVDHARHEASTIAIETPQGRVLVDTERARVTGPPLVLIPRKLERELELLREWRLAGTYPTKGPEPAFAELVLEPGDELEVTGKVAFAADGPPQLVPGDDGVLKLRKRR